MVKFDIPFTAIKLVAAITILLIGLILGRFFSKLVKKILKEVELNNIIKKEFKLDWPVEQFLVSFIRYSVYFVALVIALNQIGLAKIILYVILGGVLLFIVVFMILAIKDFIPNVISGFLIQHRKLLKKGDKIKVKDIEGKVVDITLTEIQIKSGNEIIVVPNSVLSKEIIWKK